VQLAKGIAIAGTVEGTLAAAARMIAPRTPIFVR
jgi:hypothetical protein